MSISNQNYMPFLENIGFLLGKSCHVKDTLLEQHLLPEDITSSQAKVLFQIYHLKIDRPSQIGKSLNVDNSAITRMVDRLEKKSLIERHFDPDDRRSVLIKLTDLGVETVKRAIPLASNAIDELTKALNTEEVEQLRHCLQKIVMSSIPQSCQDNDLKG